MKLRKKKYHFLKWKSNYGIRARIYKISRNTVGNRLNFFVRFLNRIYWHLMAVERASFIPIPKESTYTTYNKFYDTLNIYICLNTIDRKKFTRNSTTTWWQFGFKNCYAAATLVKHYIFWIYQRRDVKILLDWLQDKKPSAI